MTSKISMNPNKASTLMLTNIGSQKTEGQKREFSYGFMKDYITKSVRGTRYFDTVQSMASVVKPSPLCMASQSYDELFKNLVESCRSFFTKEYGKNEEDFNKFVENCTKIYETPKRHESNLIIERIKFFKSENEPKIRSKVSLLSIKKSRLSIFSRHKLKGDLMKSRIKTTSAMKRTRSLTRRPKKTRRGDLYGPMIERSLSDFLDVSDEDQQQKETPNKENKKIKPFVYKLSDPEMIKKGFTVNFQPPVRLVTFRAYPSSFRPFWFQSRSWVLERYYPNNFLSWRHSKEGNGTVFYENGEPAIVFVLGRIGPVIIVYSKSQKIRDVTIKQFPVALFDTKGNGIVYDKKTGKKR